MREHITNSAAALMQSGVESKTLTMIGAGFASRSSNTTNNHGKTRRGVVLLQEPIILCSRRTRSTCVKDVQRSFHIWYERLFVRAGGLEIWDIVEFPKMRDEMSV